MSTPAEQALEAQIKAKGLDQAPRVTPAAIDAMIASQELIKVDELGMLCAITLHNGMKILGKNLGSVSRENYDEGIAKQKAYEDARNQLWPLAGFMLAEDIHRGNRPLTQEQRELPDHVQKVLGEMYQFAARLNGITDFLADDGARLTVDPVEAGDLEESAELLGKLVAVYQRRLARAGV